MPYENHSTNVGKDFARTDLRRAVLGGRFIGCDFSGNDLTGASLCGEFTSCTFNRTIRRAHQTGVFVKCEEVA